MQHSAPGRYTRYLRDLATSSWAHAGATPGRGAVEKNQVAEWHAHHKSLKWSEEPKKDKEKDDEGNEGHEWGDDRDDDGEWA